MLKIGFLFNKISLAMSGIKPSRPKGDWFMPVESVNSCLLIIDFQNFFVDKKSKGYVRESEKIKNNIVKLINFFISRGLEIYASKHFNVARSMDPFFKFYGRVIKKGSYSFNLSDLLTNYSQIKVIEKSTYSPFFNDFFMRELKAKKIEKVFLAGLLLEKCILASALDAFQKGFEVAIVRECVGGRVEKFNPIIFKIIEQSCGSIVSIKEIVNG